MKTVKAVSVYPENNPIPEKLKESFIDRFTDLINESGKLKLSILHDKIFYGDHPVFVDRSDEDVLAKIFHRSGIKEIVFTSDFNYEQASHFFNTLKKFFNREEGAEDLSDLFWSAGITGFEYTTVEDVALEHYDAGFIVHESCLDSYFIKKSALAGDESGKIQYSAIFLEDSSELETEAIDASDDLSSESYGAEYCDPVAENQMGLNPTPEEARMSLEDTALILNNTYMLEESDRNTISSILEDDAAFDIYKSTTALLREIVVKADEFPEFDETISIMEKIQTEFIRDGNLIFAGTILSDFMQVRELIREKPDFWHERVKNAIDTACGHDKLAYLSSALNGDSTISPDHLKGYLDHFDWKAVSAVTGLLGELEHRDHRFAVCDFLADRGKEQVDLIARGIFDRRWFVVRNTVDILSRVGGSKAVNYLKKAITHQDSRVRLQVALGLGYNRTEKGKELLLRLVWDPDSIVSQAAFDTVLEMTGSYGLNLLTSIMNDDRFGKLSEGNREKCIMLLSQLGGEHAVNYLADLITNWGVTGSRAREFYQRVAFKALVYNKSEKAEKVLQKMSRSWRKGLRSMASTALEKRKKLIDTDYI